MIKCRAGFVRGKCDKEACGRLQGCEVSKIWGKKTGTPIGRLGKPKGKLITTMKSDTTDEVYEILENDKGQLECGCIGYTMSKRYRGGRTCKHIRRYFIIEILQGLQREDPNTPFKYQIDVMHECKEIERLFERKEVK
jgi:hypothetical protein